MRGQSAISRLRYLAGTALAVAVLLLTGCGVAPQQGALIAAAASPSYGPDVVHFQGFREIRFGDRKPSLTGRGELKVAIEACGPQLTGAPELSPVFDGERLVLLWVHPPYRTPENVKVGTALADLHRSYPSGQALTPPAGSYVFPGLLVTKDDRAYLFLHDNSTVQKIIVGYAESVRRLYHEGFGTC